MKFDKIKEIISEALNCGQDEITLESNLKDDLGADSLDAVELSMTLEETFEITIPDEVLMTFVTVGDIVEYISSKTE